MMKKLFPILSCVFMAAVLAAAPTLVRTEFPTPDLVIAEIVVEAPGDGASDASEAIQAALTRAGSLGGGVVFLPSGTYRIDRPLRIPTGVTLRGDWLPPEPGRVNRGTVLAIYCGRGDADGEAAVTMEETAGATHLTVWYPEQSFEEPVPYPWTFRSAAESRHDITMGQSFWNVTAVNPYRLFRVGPENNALHNLEFVYATVLDTGVEITSCWDIGRLNDLYFSPDIWLGADFPGSPVTEAEQAALRRWLKQEAHGVVIYRSDWENLQDLYLSGLAVGIRFSEYGHAPANAVIFNANISDCAVAVQLDNINSYGLSLTGGALSGDRCAVYMGPAFSGLLQLNTIPMSGGDSVLRNDGAGQTSIVNCDFSGWSESAIKTARGHLDLIHCAFAAAGENDLDVGTEMSRVLLASNRFAGGEGRIAGELPPATVLDAAARNYAVPDVTPTPRYLVPRPAGDLLFNAADYGVLAGAEDNTAALQNALNAAGETGGGTVYLPAGYYRLAGNLRVPSGVELRGVFDLPHHGVGGGSVLMTTAGEGDQEARPFIELEERSGVRGLTIHYPGQTLVPPVEYPWAIRSLGPYCYVYDTTITNAWRAVDFASHRSDGHIIRHLGGGFIRQGVRVGQARQRGWVDGCQLNPHYVNWLPHDLPRQPEEHSEAFGFFNLQRNTLRAFEFGSCTDEYVDNNFSFGAACGIAFSDDDPAVKTRARVIGHGVDSGRVAVEIGCTTAEEGITFLNVQPNAQVNTVVPVNFVFTEDFSGRASFFNGQDWHFFNLLTARLDGRGEVIFQQIQTNGSVTVNSGAASFQGCTFNRTYAGGIFDIAGGAAVSLLGNTGIGPMLNPAGGQPVLAAANQFLDRAAPPVAELVLATGWEPQDRHDPAVNHWCNSVTGPVCEVTDAEAHSGRYSLRIAGEVVLGGRAPGLYYQVLDGPVEVTSDMVLSVWIKSANITSNCGGLDIVFADGGVLRSVTDCYDINFQNIHPGTPRNSAGKWVQQVIPLGKYVAGRTIQSIMLAVNSGFAVDDRLEIYFDDLMLYRTGSATEENP